MRPVRRKCASSSATCRHLPSNRALSRLTHVMSGFQLHSADQSVNRRDREVYDVLNPRGSITVRRRRARGRKLLTTKRADMVTLTFASWNRLDRWLRAKKELKCAASSS